MPEPSPSLTFLLAAWGGLALVMAGLWLRMLRTRDATSVDVAWAAGVGGCGLLAAALADGSPLQRVLAATLAAVWSGRLLGHLLRDRVWSGRGEDGRYRALRQRLGDRWRGGFFLVYQAQAVAVLPFALPFLLIARHPAEALAPLQILGLAVAAGGVLMVTVADRQLARHRADPARAGTTCRTGLWRCSRHPNYFGEWVAWCGFAMVAWPAPAGALALLTPAILWLLLHFVSGIPHVEAQALRSRGADYRRYMAETNRFFPWWPRRPAPTAETAS